MVEHYRIKGKITIECIDKYNNIIDKFVDNNLIMNSARLLISGMISGTKPLQKMNKFVLGTNGTKSGDSQTAKTELDGFVSTRTNLFSEEATLFNYPIVFTQPGTASGSCTIVSEINSGSTININYVDSNIEYTVIIPEFAANNTGTTVYSEAALYAGNYIFSMKCFPGKIKDNTVSMRIVWKIML